MTQATTSPACSLNPTQPVNVPITVARGDGIGPEIMDVAVKTLEVRSERGGSGWGLGHGGDVGENLHDWAFTAIDATLLHVIDI